MPTKSLSDIKDTLLLGGLATGCMKLKSDMSSEFSGFVKSNIKEYTDKTPANKNPFSFIAGVKFDGEDKFRSAALGSFDKAIPIIKVSEFNQSYPFADIKFTGKKLKDIDISLSVFNPCIVHNPIDSAIPSVFFEFTFKNNSDRNAMVSLCSVLKSFFSAGKSSFGYDRVSGTSYIALTEASRSVAARRRGSMCIATDSTDFTYETERDESVSFFYKKFCRNDGFLSCNADIGSDAGVKNVSAMLSCHVRVPSGKERKLKIVLSWCFPYCGDGLVGSADKNYYFHYFPDVLGCASYSVSHFERLRKESIAFMNMIYKTSLPVKTKALLGNYLKGIKSPYILRDGGGVLMNIPECNTEFCLAPFSFTLEYLFPGITEAATVKSIKNLIYAKGKSPESGEFLPFAYETDCKPAQIYSRLMLILRLYRMYRTRSDLKFFSENWVDIAYMADMLCRTALNAKMTDEEFISVYSAAVCTMKVMIDVADILVDKKRSIYFLDLYNCARKALNDFVTEKANTVASQILKAQYLAETACGLKLYCGEIIEAAVSGIDAASEYSDFFTCASLIKLGYIDKAEKVMESILTRKIANYEGELCEKATQCGVLIPAFSGFDYDKNSMVLSFKPEDTLSDEDKTFTGFISFDEAYGFVEQGIDYIEIKLLTGEIKVKKFICSHKPFRVMYAGRYHNCEIEGNTVVLESNMTVTKNKKLTVLIDITK